MQLNQRQGQGERVGVLSFSPELADLHATDQRRLPEQAEAYEAALYSALRELDQLKLDSILVEHPPELEEWLAVIDRLSKATT
jgi:L-threonylcarbamoyladenylate synthase